MNLSRGKEEEEKRGNQGNPKAQNEITSQMEAVKVVRKHSDPRDWIKQAACS